MDRTEEDALVYSIGTVSKLLGVSEQTLRLYERRGLILTHKSGGSQRRYSQLDIERLRCIRDAITLHKISIEGIRRIQSMIPCWDYVQCSMEQRSTCPAYNTPEAGCWTYKHRNNACEDLDCRDCRVYHLASDCKKVKSLIHDNAAPASLSTQHGQRRN